MRREDSLDEEPQSEQDKNSDLWSSSELRFENTSHTADNYEDDDDEDDDDDGRSYAEEYAATDGNKAKGKSNKKPLQFLI